MVIFHSYVSLPEGNYQTFRNPQLSLLLAKKIMSDHVPVVRVCFGTWPWDICQYFIMISYDVQTKTSRSQS
jgi:hypothetical protein